MAQHYTRNTVSAAAWCAKCKRQTQHRVDDRRISAACLECLAMPPVEEKKAPVPERGLFDEPVEGGR